MTDGRGWNWQAVGVILSMVATIVVGGVAYGKIDSRISQLEENDVRRDNDLRAMLVTVNEIKASTIRMETKMEILLPTNQMQERRRD